MNENKDGEIPMRVEGVGRERATTIKEIESPDPDSNDDSSGKDIEDQFLTVLPTNIKSRTHVQTLEVETAAGAQASHPQQYPQSREMSVCEEGGNGDGQHHTKRTAHYIGINNRTTTHHHQASDLLPKKRSLRKKVQRPKHANNPFLVYSIYFQNSSTKDQQLEQKLRPWEKNYFMNLNQRLRGAQSVTNGDSNSKSIFQFQQQQQQQATLDASTDSKHQTQMNSSMYRKYARSLRRSAPRSKEEEGMTFQSCLNVNRSLPPLKDQISGQQPPRTTSHTIDHSSLSSSIDRVGIHSGNLTSGHQRGFHPGAHSSGGGSNLSDARLRHIKKNLVRRAFQGQSYDANNKDLLLQDGGNRNDKVGPNEYLEDENNELILPPKFMTNGESRDGQNDRYRNNQESITITQQEQRGSRQMPAHSVSPRTEGQARGSLGDFNSIGREQSGSASRPSGLISTKPSQQQLQQSRSRFRSINHHQSQSPQKYSTTMKQTSKKEKSSQRSYNKQNHMPQTQQKIIQKHGFQQNVSSRSQLGMGLTSQGLNSTGKTPGNHTQKQSPSKVKQFGKDRLSVHVPDSAKHHPSTQIFSASIDPSRTTQLQQESMSPNKQSQQHQQHQQQQNQHISRGNKISKSMTSDPVRQRFHRKEFNNLFQHQQEQEQQLHQQQLQQQSSNNKRSPPEINFKMPNSTGANRDDALDQPVTNSFETIPRSTELRTTEFSRRDQDNKSRQMAATEMNEQHLTKFKKGEICIDRDDDDDDDCTVRLESAKKQVTNATILREHINKIKQTFATFAANHNDIQKANSAAAPSQVQQARPCSGQHTCPKTDSLQAEVDSLKRQLAERDALIVKLSKLASKQANTAE